MRIDFDELWGVVLSLRQIGKQQTDPQTRHGDTSGSLVGFLAPLSRPNYYTKDHKFSFVVSHYPPQRSSKIQQEGFQDNFQGPSITTEKRLSLIHI